ncbi:soluble calcium-activated nucleotidase 1 [Sarcoptes scabiei]|nr:soluble calcium-activated nucleotidase 1 [Sarcoptes scabiei]
MTDSIRDNQISISSKIIEFSSIMVVNFMLFSSFLSIGSAAPTPQNDEDLREYRKPYNDTYPLSPIRRQGSTFELKFATIADQDKLAVVDMKKYKSYIKYGYLYIDPKSLKVKIHFEQGEHEIFSPYNYAGRGMELSDLVVFNGKLYTCDDKSGIVFEIKSPRLIIPWVILATGDGESSGKGFKCEWMTVKSQRMFVGSFGVEIERNYDLQWVKRIDPWGHVDSLNWRHRFELLRQVAGVAPRGYLSHEAAAFDSWDQEWLFLPRKASVEAYDEKKDETSGANLLLIADYAFRKLSRYTVGPLRPTHGFSSVKIIPGIKKYLPQTIKEVAIALKTMEVGNSLETVIIVFTIPKGEVLYNETFTTSIKYEGIEFV